MKWFSRVFQNLKFRNKLATSYFFLALIPFTIFASISGSIFIIQARDTAIEHTAQATSQASNTIDLYINSIDKLSCSWINYLHRSGILELSPQDAQWKAAELTTRNGLSDMRASHPEIAGVLIALEDKRYISTGMSRISRDPFTSENWYRLAEQNPDRFMLISNNAGRNMVTTQDYSIDDVFSLVRAIVDPQSQQLKGVILFDVKHDLIKDSIDQTAIGRQGFAFVIDSNNEMVYTPVSKIVYRIDPELLNAGSPVNINISDGNYHIRTYQSPFSGWKTVGVFSMDEVFGGVNTIYPILIFCVISVIVLVTIVSFRIASSVTKPISKLQKLMYEAETGDLSVQFHHSGNDEIGSLGISFNHMIKRIDDLIQTVYQEQKSKRDAELKSLQEQIKPHFLYNTLDTINWMAREQGANDIVHLIDALTNMFRVGLSQGKDFINVKDEITHIANYLYIQQIRYKEKLNYAINVHEDLYTYTLPKLILQPLIENAIYHGLKQKRGPGTITVTGGLSENGHTLYFIVADNGAGIAKEKLQLLQRQLEQVLSNQEKQSFGLFYVAERIKLNYGDGFGVTLMSVQGQGTSVTITIPAQ